MQDIEITVKIRIPAKVTGQHPWQFVVCDALRSVGDVMYMNPNATQGKCNEPGQMYQSVYEVKGN